VKARPHPPTTDARKVKPRQHRERAGIPGEGRLRVVAICHHDHEGSGGAQNAAVSHAEAMHIATPPWRGLDLKGIAHIDAGHIAHAHIARAAAHLTANAHAAGLRGEAAVAHRDVDGWRVVGNASIIPAALYCHAIIPAHVLHALNEHIGGAVLQGVEPEGEGGGCTASVCGCEVATQGARVSQR